ncbi:hypothetical protein GCM10022221_58880 [Actinocorallia aurea]
MARGLLYVATRPASPEDAAAYHEWYENTHLKEMAAIEGVTLARRFAPLAEGDPYVALYDIEADDLASIRTRLAEAGKAGLLSAPVGVSTDPPPVLRYFRETASVTS